MQALAGPGQDCVDALECLGATAAGPRAKDMLALTRPELDFVKLAESMGVPASRPRNAEEFCRAFERAMLQPGPHLLECLV